MNNGEKIELNFQAFDLEYCSEVLSDGTCFCGYDYVEVIDIDGNYNEKFCGNNTIPDSITSTGTSMIVNMRTDYSVTRHGFAATWAAVSTFRDGPSIPRTTEEVDRVIGVYEASAWNYLQLAIEICYLGKVFKIMVIIEQIELTRKFSKWIKFSLIASHQCKGVVLKKDALLSFLLLFQ